MRNNRSLTVAARNLPQTRALQSEPRPSGSGRAAGAVARRGSALLAVLWLVAALSAVAFSVAGTVRSETGRTASSVDRLKAQYLASGAIDRALLYIEWDRVYRNPDGSSPYYGGRPHLDFQFPSGQASVDVIPETAKLSLNKAQPEELFRLFQALGADPGRAREIVLGIEDWRTQLPMGSLTSFDQYYLSRKPSFRARHASFEEIEEVLLVKGMTPELFYGTYESDAKGRLQPRHGARECLSAYQTGTAVDANTADAAVLAAVGVPGDMIGPLIARRRVQPFRTAEELKVFAGSMPRQERLRVGGDAMYTIRATARVRLPDGTLSDARRSVGVLVKFLDTTKFSEPYHILRWYDNVWVE